MPIYARRHRGRYGIADKSSAWREITRPARIAGTGGVSTRRTNRLPSNVRSDRVT